MTPLLGWLGCSMCIIERHHHPSRPTRASESVTIERFGDSQVARNLTTRRLGRKK
jgi:hypothetical protein